MEKIAKQKVLEEYEEFFTNNGKHRYVILMGGRGGGRSTVASQFALSNLISEKYFRCAIMRFVLGDIRNSIYREITDRISEQKVENNLEITDNKMSISYGMNSINAVGFRKSSGDQKSKLKSLAGYTTVIIEEADEVNEDDFMQLDDSLRTIKGDITIVLLLNPPPAEHWIIKRWFDLEKNKEAPDGYFDTIVKDEYKHNTLFIESNYLNNIKNLSEDTIFNYENYRHTRLHYYWNTIKGLVPQTVYGKIYQGWKFIDGIPHEARLIRRGLDFGYSVDPTVIIDIYEYNGGYILDEIFYRKGASNKVIADFLTALDKDILVIADSAEPKSIDEIADYGVNIIGAKKGAGSVAQGIQYVKDQKISLTKKSLKTIKAYENYVWATARDGAITNKPDDTNHEWSNSMDALRYGFNGMGIQKEMDEMEVSDNIFE